MQRWERSSALLALAVLFACGGETGVVQEPVPLPDPSPVEYPVALWDRKVEGETEVMIHVNEAGDVDSVLVSQSSGYADFDSAAVRGARRLRFSPGRRGDRPAAMWTTIPIRFSQEAAASFGETRSPGRRDE